MLDKRIDVLDKGWVELQDVMGDDLAIVSAARTSYLGESKGTKADHKLLHYLMNHRHDGPFEMGEFKFRLHAPEIVWRQLLRHRTGSYNLQSYRYTKAKEDEFYIPLSNQWRLQDHKNKQGSVGLLETDGGGLLTSLLEEHIQASMTRYELAIAQGVARELARVFLPAFALYSTGIIKMNVRNLIHLCDLRRAPDAQWETRQYADVMWTYLQEHFPVTCEAWELYRK